MEKVPTEFYKNVFLLTNFVEPHCEFRKHFKEGMFDKPNTTGFIHVTYYLLNVYYKNNIKNKVQWPIICKQTENKFRKDVRECLLTIAQEHSDVNFPPILASHLLLAKGSKFILIMWKFSLVVLRAYLQQEHNVILTSTPKAGLCMDLTSTYLKKITADNHNTASEIRKNREHGELTNKIYQEQKNQEINELKALILKLKDKLKHITFNAPVTELTKTRLLNIEDTEILNLWSNSIDDKITNLQQNYESLKDIDDCINYIVNIVLNLAGNTLKLNSANFDKINVESIYKSISREKQVLLYNLYQKDSLNLQNLFSIFHLLLQKYSMITTKIELLKCDAQLQISSKDVKLATNRLETMYEEILNFNSRELKKEDLLDLQNTSNTSEFDKVLFMPSPSIDINSSEGKRHNNQNFLQLTPIEGAHKKLFSRHALSDEENAYSLNKKPMPVIQINFDDHSFFESSNDKLDSITQQRFSKSLKLRKYNFKNAGKYSRVFSVLKPNNSIVNKSISKIIPSTENSILPLVPKEKHIHLIDSCNFSQELSQDSLLMSPNLNSTREPGIQHAEPEKVLEKSNKRRSISDLVEKYKKLLQKRDTNSQESALDSTQEDSEEAAI